MGLQPADEVLVPAHHDHSVVDALGQAGLRPRFYEGSSRLEPDPEELDSLLGPRVGALYLVHPLGFPQDAMRWRAWCDARELRLLEDATQAFLTLTDDGPAGSFGDLSLFSLSRALGLSDGAALVVGASAAPGPELGHRLGVAAVVGLHLHWLMARSPAPAGAYRGRRPAGRGEEEDRGVANPEAGPCSATVHLLPRLARRGVAGRRRANYASLLEQVGEFVPPPFDRLPPAASPFALPIATDRPGRLLERLAASGIIAEDFWASPHSSLPSDRFPLAAWRRQGTVLLPVHQGLGPVEVARIAEVVRGSRRSQPSLRIERIGTLDALGSEWNELAARSRNVFATSEWLSTWWRHFGRDRPLFVLACCDRAGRLVAIMPLYLASTAPVRVLRSIGHGAGDQLGPICDPRHRPPAATALRGWLARPSPRWDVLVGQQFPEDEGWGALLGATTLGREGSPVLRIHGRSWEEVLASLSYGLRKEVRSHERKLARGRELHYRLADDPARLDHDLDLLFYLHGQQWTDGTSAFGPHEAFHREFAALALRRGWLRLWFLEVDGKPVAAKYNLRFAGVEFSYQAGRDPDWTRSSVGLVILAHAIRTAAQDGVDEYRFLRGGESYKYRFADTDPGLETLVLGPGAVTSAGVAASRLVRASRRLSGLRDWLPE